jgi:adenylate cyclase
MLRPGRRFDFEEARQASGLDPEVFDQVHRVAGFGQSDGFTELDVEALQVLATGLQLYSTEELLHFSRVVNSAMGRVAEADVALFRVEVAAQLEARGGTELELAPKNYEAGQLVESMHVPIRAFLLQQLQLSVRRTDRGREFLADSTHASTLRLSVGFVDMVGYTPITESLGPAELGRFVQRFENRAYDIAVRHDGRVVKLIGDEVMFVAADPDDACRIAEALVVAFVEVDALPRGGSAYGDVVSRGGDYYGSVVNLASRIADLAVPGEILVDEATTTIAEGFGFETAGRRQLKGLADPLQLWSLRR